MIKIKQYFREKGKCYCKSCGRYMSLLLTYEISCGDGYNKKLSLCEDCSNALSKLHYMCMDLGESTIYDEDEFYKKGSQTDRKYLIREEYL